MIPMSPLMETSKQQEISARAVSLIESHFELLNRGDLAAARAQLFFPAGMDARPLDVYVDTMKQIAPFQVISSLVKRFEEPRQKRHGVVATIWVSVEVRCSLGDRSTDIIVWWFPDEDKYQISARPSHWVLEKLRGEEDRGP